MTTCVRTCALALLVSIVVGWPNWAQAQTTAQYTYDDFLAEKDCHQSRIILDSLHQDGTSRLPERAETDLLDRAEQCPDLASYFKAELTTFYRRWGRYRELVKFGEGLRASGEIYTFDDSIRVIGNLYGAYTYYSVPHKLQECLELLDSLDKSKRDAFYGDYGPSLIDLYQVTGQYRKCIELCRQDIPRLMAKGNVYLALNLYNNIGVYFNYLGEPDSAIAALDQGLALLDTAHQGSSWHLLYGLMLGNKGTAFKKRGQCTEALELFAQDALICKRLGQHWNVTNSLLELAECQLELGNTAAAQAAIDSCTAFIQREGTANMLMSYYGTLAELKREQQQYDQATELLLKRQQITDSISATTRENQLTAMQVMYEVDKTNRELQDARIAMAEQDLQVQKEHSNVLLLTGGLVALAVIVVLTFIQVRRVRRRETEVRNLHAQTRDQKAVIEKSLREKEALLKEIHHRVKNNLQVISGLLQLQANRSDSPEVKAVMADGQTRIQSMAMVHQMLYQTTNFATLPFRDYLNKLTSLIAASNRKNRSIELQIEADQMVLEPDLAIPLGLIVNELVTNAYKHAFPDGEGQINITLRQHDGRMELVISDNGSGLPTDLDPSTARSTGLRLVQVLVQQIKAELRVEKVDGARWVIAVPTTTQESTIEN